MYFNDRVIAGKAQIKRRLSDKLEPDCTFDDVVQSIRVGQEEV